MRPLVHLTWHVMCPLVLVTWYIVGVECDKMKKRPPRANSTLVLTALTIIGTCNVMGDEGGFGNVFVTPDYPS